MLIKFFITPNYTIQSFFILPSSINIGTSAANHGASYDFQIKDTANANAWTIPNLGALFCQRGAK